MRTVMTTGTILLSHPTANQNVRQTARALAESGLLREFWTCVNWKEGEALDRFVSIFPRLGTELRRRSFPAELRPFIKTSPWREWGRQLFGQLGLAGNGFFSLDAVYHSFDRRVAERLPALPGLKAVYAYDGGALETFRRAKRLGIKCIYEHPIVSWRKARELQRAEAALHPEWTSTLLALHDSEEKLARKDEELALADVIIAPSTFARESLALVPNLHAQITVIPYGAPASTSDPARDDSSEKMRVLFVGALSQAKGLGYLLEAIGRLDRGVDLTLIGHRMSATAPSKSVLDQYRWLPSMPHERLLEEMSRHHVLVFPSLHEGFGLVILEAMSRGALVITTAHTAGPDLIEDGVDGFLTPIQSSEAIAEKLKLLQQDRARLRMMREAARLKAASYSWEKYRHRAAALARAVIEGN